MKFRRQHVLSSSVMAVLGLALLCGCPDEQNAGNADGRPNVLLVTLDTTRTERLSCYGHSVKTSPTLDALAQDGVKFDLGVVQAAVTPVSHASIMTGLNPYQHGVRVLYAKSGYRLSGSVPTLATVLGEEGWSTGAFLSAYPVSERFGLDQGFDKFDNGLSEEAEKTLKPTDDGDTWMWDVKTNQRRSDDTTDRVIDWVKSVRRPFFAWVHYWDPHDTKKLPPQEIVDRFTPPNADQMPPGTSTYDGEVFYVDSQFGRLIQTLKDMGIYDNTVIAVVADHGQGLEDGLARHNWLRHRLLYQEQIRVPLVVRLPGGPRGVTVSDLVRSIDIFPTILEAVEVTPQHRVEGRSLRGLMENQPEPPRLAYADQINEFDLNATMATARQRRDPALPRDDLLYCMMDRTWKLIYRPTDPDRSELYNLETDPQELRNLYHETPDQAQRLLNELKRLEPSPFVDHPFEAVLDEEAQEGQRELDVDVLNALRGLGYIEDQDEEPADQPAPTTMGTSPDTW